VVVGQSSSSFPMYPGQVYEAGTKAYQMMNST